MGTADLSGLVEGDLLVLDEAALPEVLITVLLLLGLILGHVGGVTPTVIGVVTLDNLVILGLLDHLHLVDAPLAIVARPGGSHGREAHVSVITSLPLVPRVKSSEGSSCWFLMMVMVVAMMAVPAVRVEREGVDKGTRIPVVHGGPRVPPQGPFCIRRAEKKHSHEKFASCHVEKKKACRCFHEHCPDPSPH